MPHDSVITEVTLMIDINTHAENFHEDMLVYCTGAWPNSYRATLDGYRMEFVDETGITKQPENPFVQYIDERFVQPNGLATMSCACYTPDTKNWNTICMFFTDPLPEHLLKMVMERAKMFAEKHNFEINCFRTVVKTVTTTVSVRVE